MIDTAMFGTMLGMAGALSMVMEKWLKPASTAIRDFIRNRYGKELTDEGLYVFFRFGSFLVVFALLCLVDTNVSFLDTFNIRLRDMPDWFDAAYLDYFVTATAISLGNQFLHWFADLSAARIEPTPEPEAG